MEEIEVGEYIRNKEGYIDRVTKIIEIDDEFTPEKFYCCDIIMAGSYKSEIVKHSKQLIDLIEVGDMVNGVQVIKILPETFGRCKSIELANHYIIKCVDLLAIETILTKEQYEANCYNNRRKR